MTSQRQQPKVSIIIPAYNEERRIAKTLDIYSDYFNSRYQQEYEILVVLNGCKDRTEEIAKDYSGRFTTLRYFNFADPIGKGGAIVEGYKQASGDLVAYADADSSAGPDMIEKLFEVLRQNPEVTSAIGSRNLQDSQTKGRTVFRKILTKGFNTTVNVLFGLKIKDTQCGAKALRKATLEDILPDLSISNLSFDVNLLFEVKRRGGKILEVPIVWTDDYDSTIKRPVKASIIMFLSVLRLRIINSPIRRLYPIIHPFSEFAWKLLLTDKEREYLWIRHK